MRPACPHSHVAYSIQMKVKRKKYLAIIINNCGQHRHTHTHARKQSLGLKPAAPRQDRTIIHHHQHINPPNSVVRCGPVACTKGKYLCCCCDRPQYRNTHTVDPAAAKSRQRPSLAHTAHGLCRRIPNNR